MLTNDMTIKSETTVIQLLSQIVLWNACYF